MSTQPSERFHRCAGDGHLFLFLFFTAGYFLICALFSDGFVLHSYRRDKPPRPSARDTPSFGELRTGSPRGGMSTPPFLTMERAGARVIFLAVPYPAWCSTRCVICCYKYSRNCCVSFLPRIGESSLSVAFLMPIRSPNCLNNFFLRFGPIPGIESKREGESEVVCFFL